MTKGAQPSLPQICTVCDTMYEPKAGGYNSRYCSSSCKARARYVRVTKGTPDDRRARLSYRKKWYAKMQDNEEFVAKHLAHVRRSARKVRAWLAAYKLSIGCVDCGYNAHFAALQLDHRGVKKTEISAARSSIARLMQVIEEENCEVRCANCHAIRTWQDKQIETGEHLHVR